MESHNVFGDLRVMLRQTPSEKSFIEVVTALNGLFANAHDEAASRVLPFVVDSMRSWPDEVRLFEFSDATHPDILPTDGRILAVARRLRFTCPEGHYDRGRVLDADRVRALLTAASTGELPLDLAELHVDADAYPHLIGAFTELDALRRVRRIGWSSSDPSTSPLTAFAQAPWAQTVEGVFMDGRGVSSDEHELIVACPFGALRALDAKGLELGSLEGLYPELEHVRLPAGPAHDTAGVDAAFPALTSLVLDGIEDVVEVLLTLGEPVVTRLSALSLHGEGQAFDCAPGHHDPVDLATVSAWCAEVERVSVHASSEVTVDEDVSERHPSWLEDASIDTLWFPFEALFDHGEFLRRSGCASPRALGCVVNDEESLYGVDGVEDLEALSLVTSKFLSFDPLQFGQKCSGIKCLRLYLSERSRIRATPRQLERRYDAQAARWLESDLFGRLDELTLADVGCFRPERLVELYRLAERAGMRRFDLWLPLSEPWLDEVWRQGTIPFAQVCVFASPHELFETWSG